MRVETYTLDLSPQKKLIAYGTQEDEIVFTHYPSLSQVSSYAFEDSVIYVKFLKDNLCFVATLNGYICIVGLEEDYIEDENITSNYSDNARPKRFELEVFEIKNYLLEEDITFAIVNDFILVGTEKGSIHVYDRLLNEELLFFGHHSAIKDLKVFNNTLLSLSNDKFIIYSLENQNVLAKLDVLDGICFNYLETFGVLFLATNIKSMFIRNDILLSEYVHTTECTLIIDDWLIFGGNGPVFNIVDVKNNYTHRRILFDNEEIEGINKIVSLSGRIIAFSTFCGKVGIGQLFDFKNFKFINCNVGIIFDFLIDGSNLLACGTDGIKIIKL